VIGRPRPNRAFSTPRSAVYPVEENCRAETVAAGVVGQPGRTSASAGESPPVGPRLAGRSVRHTGAQGRHEHRPHKIISNNGLRTRLRFPRHCHSTGARWAGLCLKAPPNADDPVPATLTNASPGRPSLRLHARSRGGGNRDLAWVRGRRGLAGPSQEPTSALGSPGRPRLG
jgi:hypothetical protein